MREGTYIRALARDIGRALQSGAYLTQLCRTKSGDSHIENCLSLDTFDEWLAQQTIETDTLTMLRSHREHLSLIIPTPNKHNIFYIADMKLSQFKFKLPEEQIALYPHSIYREFENDNGEGRHSASCAVTNADLWSFTRSRRPSKCIRRTLTAILLRVNSLDFRNILDYFDPSTTPLLSTTRRCSPPVSMARRGRQTPRLRCSSCAS